MKYLSDLHTHTIVSGHAYTTLFENINYCKEKMEYNYSRFIFPKIYGMSYNKAVQMTIDDYDDEGNVKDKLNSDEDLINLSNALGKVRGRIKKGSNKNPVAHPDA